MIRSLTIKNFTSFPGETRLDFTVGKAAPGITSFLPSLGEERVTSVAALFGPNASGKTNLLKALDFALWFPVHSFQELAPQAALPIESFLGEVAATPVEVRLDYEGKAGVFRYLLSATREGVQREELLQQAETGYFRYLLRRVWTDDQEEVIHQQDLGLDLNILKRNLRRNCSIVSLALQTGNLKLTEATQDLSRIVSTACGYRNWTSVRNVGGALEKFLGETKTSRVVEAANYFEKHPEDFATLRQLLRRADLGISDLELRRFAEMGSDETWWSLAVLHGGGPGGFDLGIQDESTGTRQLFLLYRQLLPVLRQGGVAVIDELERDLHPHLLPPILKLFTTPATNPLGAQLVFTSHCLELLSLLDKAQIFLIEKDAQCRSDAYRLDSVQGVRRGENHFTKYNAGAYGAVPDV